MLLSFIARMGNKMELILFVLGVGNLVLLFLLYQQRTADNKRIRDLLEDQEDHLSDQLDYRFERERQAQQITGQQIEMAISDRLMELRTEMHQQTTALRAELAEKFYLKTETKRTNGCNRFKPPMICGWSRCVKRSKKSWKKPCTVVFKPLLRQSPNNWSRSIKGWEKCRQWRGMSEPWIKFSPIPRRVGLWANCSWVKSLKISWPQPVWAGVCHRSPIQWARGVCH